MSVLDHVILPPGADPKECIKEGFGVLSKILDADINPTAGDVVDGFQKVLGVTDVTGYSTEEFTEVLQRRIHDVSEDVDAAYVLGLLLNIGVAAVMIERDRRKAGNIKYQFDAAMDQLKEKLRSRGQV